MTVAPGGPPWDLQVCTFGSMAVEAVAVGGGFLERVGLKVTVHHARSSKEQMQGLREGAYHVVHTSPDNVMHERCLARSDAVAFLVLDTGLPQSFVIRNPHSDWEDLRGGVLGVDAADSGYAFVAYEMLRQRGFVRDVDYEVLSLGSSRGRFDALLAGRIDACLLGSHQAAEAVGAGCTSLAGASAFVPWYPAVTPAVTRGFADANPDIIRRYAEALTASMRWAVDEANAAAVQELVADSLQISTAQARAVVAMEAASRTALLPSWQEAAAGLDQVAALRSSATGQEVSGYFDPAWMRQLDAAARAGSRDPGGRS
jgi:ABC-type nitrate/sulfonate/bicarbonate transport system substrate-binding protein